MAKSRQLRVLCYDISSNQRRRKVSAILEECSSRVQKSVFEARLTASKLRRVVARIGSIIEVGDSLRVYTIGRPGEQACEVLGSGVRIETESGYWLL